MNRSLQSSINDIINQQDVGQNDVVENLLNLLYEVNFKEESATKTLNDLFDDNLEKWQTKTNQNELVETGFEKLDNAIGGFYPGELIVIGSKPSEGKTQFLINLALNISKNHSSLFYSYDLSNYLISSRFVSTLSGIPLEDLLRRKLSNDQKELLQNKITELSQQQLLIHSGANTSINAFKLMTTKFIRENGVKVIFIDFVQLLYSTKYRRNKEQSTSQVSRELKKFAKENMVLIIATSQLNRAVEIRTESKIPMLSDLRRSGSIEQAADKVMFIYSLEDVNEESAYNQNSFETNLRVAKNRNGITATVKLTRDASFTTFLDLKD